MGSIVGIGILLSWVTPVTSHAMSEGDGLRSSVYRNSVLARDFPDPTVIRAEDGRYYAYATQSDPGYHIHIQVARSSDLVHWHHLGDALPKLPEWGDDTNVSWAPHVLWHGGRYLLYYSIVPDELSDQFGLCLAVATSESPAGPFRTTDSPLYCGDTLSDIDGAVFHDPATGRWHLYWGSGGDIVTARLAPSLLRLAPGEQPQLLLRGWSSKHRRPYEHGIEGPYVIHRAGWYFLFYSGDRCCEYPPHYATMVARSRHATGPFHRLGDVEHLRDSAILRENDTWAGPGHNSVIRDAAGQDWIVYHAINREHPYVSNGGVRRVMLIDRLDYVDGWPVVGDGTPSTSRHAGPVTAR
jgi:arabinan endo-1,5-alpha-L-arabinosidase